MQEEPDFTPEFIKGFNDGYDLSEHEPELLKNLLSVKDKNASERLQGMISGDIQQQKDILRKEHIAMRDRQKTKSKHR